MKQKNKDMYLPSWIRILGIVFLILSCVCLILSFSTSIYLLIGFIACFLLGSAAIMCWKNQGINMTDNNMFIYTTMFGKETQYSFSEIRELKQNADSSTLILDNGKVHIESSAIMSEKFMDTLNNTLERL